MSPYKLVSYRFKKVSLVCLPTQERVPLLKLLSERSIKVSCVRLPNENGIGPKKLHPSASKKCKDLRLSIESGSMPKKPVPASLKSSRGILLLNSGTFPVRFELKCTPRDLRFGSRKIPVGNSPCKPQFLRKIAFKEVKFVKVQGRVDDMSTSLRTSSCKFISFSAILLRLDLWSFNGFKARSRETNLESCKISDGI